MKTKIALFSLLIAGIVSASAVNFANPVLPGDFPDPSVVRVGTNYWATATSSEWAPLFPILHSTDLVNWELKGHIFDKKPAWSSQNYWAPEISFYEGKFYVYYVGRKNEATGVLHIAVATADKPEGPWTDHGPLIGQPEGSIDAVTQVDEHGDRYMLWKNDGNSRGLPTYIFAQKLSSDGTKLVGEIKQLIRNDADWEGNLVEGPAVVKHGEYFYLFYAANGCCGKNCTYGVGVARATSLLGPYEKDPANPIMTRNEKWRCPGHGTIVSTPDGRDYFLYHAYDNQSFVYVGRQGVLDEIKWNANGWPTVNDGKGTSIEAASPLDKAQRADLEFSDDFTTPTLNLRWQWPHVREPNFELKEGKLVLKSRNETGSDLFGSVLAVQTTTADYAATAFIDSREIKPGTKAGLFAFGDLQNALGIVMGDGELQLVRRQRSKDDTLGSAKIPAQDKIYLRMEAKEGHLFRFSVWNGTKWENVGPASDLEGQYLPPWDRGVRIALTVGGNPNAETKIEWLRVVPTLETARAN